MAAAGRVIAAGGRSNDACLDARQFLEHQLKGERHEDTIAREVREETGLSVKAGRLLKVRSGYRYRIEVYYEATLIGGLDGITLDPREILEARLFSIADLPAAMPEPHRELARSLADSEG